MFVNYLVPLIVVVAVATATRGTEATWLLEARLGLECTATMRDIWVFTFPIPFLFHFFFYTRYYYYGFVNEEFFFWVFRALLFCILFWVCCFYINYGLVQKFLRVFLILVESVPNCF